MVSQEKSGIQPKRVDYCKSVEVMFTKYGKMAIVCPILWLVRPITFRSKGLVNIGTKVSSHYMLSLFFIIMSCFSALNQNFNDANANGYEKHSSKRNEDSSKRCER